MVALHHARRLKDTVRWQQATAGLSPAQILELELLRECVAPDPDSETPQRPAARHLSAKLSDISTDSFGLPSLRSFEAPALTKGRAPPPPRDVDARTVLYDEQPGDDAAGAAERARLLQQAAEASPPPCRKRDIKAILAAVHADDEPAPTGKARCPKQAKRTRAAPKSKGKGQPGSAAKAGTSGPDCKAGGWTLTWEGTRSQWLCRNAAGGPGSTKSFKAAAHGGSQAAAKKAAEVWLKDR